MINFTDAVLLDGEPRITSDGYMVATARAARTGVQTYLRAELGLDGDGTINVYRPEAEVFKADSLASYAAKPVTVGHPGTPVNASTWREVGIGNVGADVMRDGEFVRVPLILMDAEGIEKARTTHREISMGYSAQVVMRDGVAPDGTPYEAEQQNIKINHLAFVERARGGSKLRIGDGAGSWGACPVTSERKPEKEKIMTLKTVTVDGIPVEVTDQGATVIATLQTRLADATKKITDAEASHARALADKDTAHAAAISAKDKELADKDAELAKKDAEIDAAKANVVDAAALDKLVQARGGLIATARSIAKDVKTDGLTDAEIRKAVVVAVKGEDRVKDKSDAYIDAAFDNLVEDAAKGTPDPVRGVILGGVKTVGDAETQANDAWAKGLVDLNAWRKEG